jgi:heme exporter protein CcmD
MSDIGLFTSGKYAAFIWSAYGISALVLVVMVLAALGHSRRWRRRAEELGHP